jgi:chitodextrinase
VTVAWTASTDNVKVVSYTVWAPNGPLTTVADPQTTATLTGLRPGTAYQIRVRAFDAAYNGSADAVVDVTTQPDVSAPPAPTGLAVGTTVLGEPVDGITASKVLLRWTNVSDDLGRVSYEVLVDGVVTANAFDTRPQGTPYGPASTVWVRQLDPSTTYQFRVRAVDASGNRSAPSDPLTVTTDPGSGDVTPPTAATLTSAVDGGTGSCPEELWLRWTGSTDNADPAAAIEYEVRVNGTIIEVVPGATQTITYTETTGTINVTIVAVDSAGNAAAPSNAIPVFINVGGSCLP